MTHPEFAVVMTYLAASCGKDTPDAQMEVYWDCLKDLSANEFQCAARRAVSESRYPVLPAIGTLRAMALELRSGPRMTAIEAWELVWRAINRFDWDGEKEALASLPPLIARTARAMGWYSLCFPGGGKTGIARAQFIAAYEMVCTNHEKYAALPSDIRQQLRLDELGHPEEFPKPNNRRNEAIADAVRSRLQLSHSRTE